MDNKRLDPRIAAELNRLALLPDSEIDTSDVQEVTDWSRAVRGRFSSVALDQKGYDIRAIANWVLDYLRDCGISATNMSLNKLVYFIFERSIVERRALLSPARVEAWNHGPVFREIYHALKANDDRAITVHIVRYSVRDRENVEARDQFSADDTKFFKSVVDDYKSFNAPQLRRISHRAGGPWDRVWNSGVPVNPGMVISPGLILFSAPDQRDLDG